MTVKVNDGWSCNPEIVRKSLQFERGPSSNYEGALKQGLERYDDLLPSQRSERALEGSAGRLNEPA